MMKIEPQKDLFNQILSQKSTKDERISIYQELVFMRFEEVIKSSLPIFSNSISKNKLTKLIKEFISYGAKSYFVYKVPFEFFDYLKKYNLISKKEKELLEFESKQIKIYTANKKTRATKYSQKKQYKLSQNANITKTSYNILNTNDKTQYILTYKDNDNYGIYYIQITETLYLFLKLLRNKTIKKAIKLISKHKNIKYKELEEILLIAVKNFATKGIIE